MNLLLEPLISIDFIWIGEKWPQNDQATLHWLFYYAKCLNLKYFWFMHRVGIPLQTYQKQHCNGPTKEPSFRKNTCSDNFWMEWLTYTKVTPLDVFPYLHLSSKF